MSLPSHQSTQVELLDPTSVGLARRKATALAGRVGMSSERQNDVALVVTEAATNVLQHARTGTMLFRILAGSPAGLEVVALDSGPGMANVARCMDDGYSTGGSRGVGLGCIQRLSSALEIYSQPEHGTVLVARLFDSRSSPVPSFAAIAVACPGEEVTGDGWAMHQVEGVTTLLVVDGLGHGEPACEAALAAIHSFRQGEGRPPSEVLERIHGDLKGTRGAAGAIVAVDWQRGTVAYVGVGNVAASVIHDAGSRSLSSHNGILGQARPRFQRFEYPCPREATVVIHTDGLSSRWSLGTYPGLVVRDAALVAGVLYRDFLRQRDDRTVVVLRAPGSIRPTSAWSNPASPSSGEATS